MVDFVDIRRFGQRTRLSLIALAMGCAGLSGQAHAYLDINFGAGGYAVAGYSAQLYSDGTVSSSGGVGSQQYWTAAANFTPAGNQSLTGSANVGTAGSPGCNATGSSNISVSAAYGSLSGSGGASAQATSSCGPALVSAGGHVNVPSVAAFYDSLSFVSATVSAGTPVTVLITQIFNGTAALNTCTQGGSCITTSTDNFLRLNTGGNQVINADVAGTGTGSTLVSYLLNQTAYQNAAAGQPTVGGSYVMNIEDHLDATVSAASWGPLNPAEATTFAGSATLCVDVLTPGVSYVSAAGATYCSAFATPEPGTMGLLPAAMTVLLASRVPRFRRRRR